MKKWAIEASIDTNYQGLIAGLIKMYFGLNNPI